MNSESLFAVLRSIAHRPTPFSAYTAADLWNEAHTSARMLSFHLDSENDVASRRSSDIDASVAWMNQRFGLSRQSRVIDFGCGPGLYTSRLARLGAKVLGIDFSARSIEYASTQAERENQDETYVLANYLDLAVDGAYDLITMIMYDYCALSPEQRATMLATFRKLLSPTGHIVLDVYSLHAFAEKQEEFVCEENLLDGFWSAEPYFGFRSSFKYEEHLVSLDRYTIVEEQRQRDVYNWLQYFSPEGLGHEASAAGLQVEELCGDVLGNPYAAGRPEFAVVMKADR